MSHIRYFIIALVVAMVVLGTARRPTSDLSVHARPLAAGAPLGTGFTYQGVLDDGGTPVNDTCDLQFALWDASSDGTQIGGVETESSVSLTDGQFTVALNDSGTFGDDAFDGQERWLEIDVRCPAGSGPYTTLSPRQPVSAAPYALSAADAERLDGRVAAELVAADRARRPTDNTITPVDTAGDQGGHNVITIGVDGLPVIAYLEGTTTLKVMHCNDLACSGGGETISTVDSSTTSKKYLSIAIGTDDYPVIAYFDNSNKDLIVAHCNDIACTGGDETISVVDSAGSVGWHPSITIGTDGLPIISYRYASGVDDLKVAHCNDVACAGGDETISTVDSAGVVGGYSSIAIGVDGLPVISHADATNTALRVVHCNDVSCTGSNETSTIVDSSNNSFWGKLVIGADGLPIIAYQDDTLKDLKVVHCNDIACTGGNETVTTVESAGQTGEAPSIAIGRDGYPIIAYGDVTSGQVKVVRCTDLACAGSDETPLSLDTVNPGKASITIGIDGLPVVSYRVNVDKDLYVAHCGSPFCVPHFRRR